MSWSRVRRERALDAGIVLVLAAVQVAGLLWYRTDSTLGLVYTAPDALGVVLGIGSVAVLWWRRRWPVLVCAAVTALSTAYGVLGYAGLGTTPALAIAVFTAGSRAPLPRSALGAVLGGGCTLVYLLWLRSAAGTDAVDGFTVAVSVLSMVVVWGLGRALRGRRLYTAALEARAEHLEASRSAEVRAALSGERTRIARELHDVVAHSVAVMTVQAAGARRTVDRDPAAAARAMAAVETTGRSALAEMRRLVAVLRDPDDAPARAPADGPPGLPSAAPGTSGTADTSPAPGLADLPALVESVRHAGLPVDLREEGRDAVAARGLALSAGAQLATYRVVQEALTNVLRHAGPARAEVLLRWTPRRLTVVVHDDGRGPRGSRDERRGPPGHGLIGMRERLLLYGGELRTGSRLRGGFAVVAVLPLSAEEPGLDAAEPPVHASPAAGREG